jgi:hypothetical protein
MWGSTVILCELLWMMFQLPEHGQERSC